MCPGHGNISQQCYGGPPFSSPTYLICSLSWNAPKPVCRWSITWSEGIKFVVLFEHQLERSPLGIQESLQVITCMYILFSSLIQHHLICFNGSKPSSCKNPMCFLNKLLSDLWKAFTTANVRLSTLWCALFPKGYQRKKVFSHYFTGMCLKLMSFNSLDH